MLDARNYDRDLTDLYYNTDYAASIADETNRLLMGEKQERWLCQNLVDSQQRGAIWVIVGQQIIVNHLKYGEADFPVDDDACDAYEANTRRMLTPFEVMTTGTSSSYQATRTLIDWG
jgi:alkaline phosphatase D